MPRPKGDPSVQWQSASVFSLATHVAGADRRLRVVVREGVVYGAEGEELKAGPTLVNYEDTGVSRGVSRR